MPFFVNPSMAHKSGCTLTDIELLKKLIPHAYAHTRSHARPFVELRHAWYCEHSNPLGSCSDYALIDALKPKRKGDSNVLSKSWDDYEVPTGLPPELASKVIYIDLVNG
jgi:CRISPR-associated protein Csd2